jgi:two-component system, cell cycle sensor histidine kinase and response regulator CckA
VIMNLAVNARDAMPTGGTLTIETFNSELDEDYVSRHAAVPLEPGRYATLSVTDTGVGIDEATRSQVFDPFFTTKDADKGTGLGLSTVYGIARQSGGFVWVYSEPGHGATFKVYLPIATTDDDTTHAPPADSGAEAAGGSETVLVVEDEGIVRTLVRRILEANGYTVLEASNGSEALDACERHEGEIHLVVADTVMPGVSGPQLGEQLLTRRPGVKLLYMSGYSDLVLDERGLADTGAAFIQKPFTSDALAREAHRLLHPPDA